VAAAELEHFQMLGIQARPTMEAREGKGTGDRRYRPKDDMWALVF